MKRRLITHLQAGLIVVMLAVTVLLICPTAVGRADTAADINPVTQKPITFLDNLDDLLPPGDPNADIVRAALERYNIRTNTINNEPRYLTMSGQQLGLLPNHGYTNLH